jgi:hypothetical protein
MAKECLGSRPDDLNWKRYYHGLDLEELGLLLDYLGERYEDRDKAIEKLEAERQSFVRRIR